MYIISLTRQDIEPCLYVTRGYEGYPEWTDSISSARLFTTIDYAMKELSEVDYTKNVVFPDGSVSPPRMIHSGLGLSIYNTTGEGVIEIKEFILESRFKIDVKAKLNPNR